MNKQIDSNVPVGESSRTLMDKPIRKKSTSVGKVVGIVIGLVIIVSLSLMAVLMQSKRTLRVERQDVTLATVTQGEYRDTLQVRAMFTPITTVYIDAVQGGTVQAIYAEVGDAVTAGQVLLRFDNTAFQSAVFSQEAQILEQLDTNSTTRLQLDQNRLDLERRLSDIEFAITKLQRDIERSKVLVKQQFISQKDMDALRDELAYQHEQKAINQRALAQEDSIRESKIAHLTDSAVRLTEHLEVVRRRLESLEVKAPVTGMLTALDAEIGEIKPDGARLGQVDDIRHYKLEAQVDQYYAGRLQVGQRVDFALSGQTYYAQVSKINPQVVEGFQTIHLRLEGDPPAGAKPGLSVSAQLQLGDNTSGLLLTFGGFYQDTGGHWAFVVDPDTHRAVRRTIKTNRHNSNQIEITEGVKPGDVVIVSSYANWADVDEIILEP